MRGSGRSSKKSENSRLRTVGLAKEGRSYSVCCSDVWLLPNHATSRGEISRSDGCTICVVEDATRAVRAKILDRIFRTNYERIRERCPGNVHRSNTKRVNGGGMAFGSAGSGN